jgi:hypothetical protein
VFSAQVSLVRPALARIVSLVAKLSVAQGAHVAAAHAVVVAAAAISSGALIQIQLSKQELLTFQQSEAP